MCHSVYIQGYIVIRRFTFFAIICSSFYLFACAICVLLTCIWVFGSCICKCEEHHNLIRVLRWKNHPCCFIITKFSESGSIPFSNFASEIRRRFPRCSCGFEINKRMTRRGRRKKKKTQIILHHRWSNFLSLCIISRKDYYPSYMFSYPK